MEDEVLPKSEPPVDDRVNAGTTGSGGLGASSSAIDLVPDCGTGGVAMARDFFQSRARSWDGVFAASVVVGGSRTQRHKAMQGSSMQAGFAGRAGGGG